MFNDEQLKQWRKEYSQALDAVEKLKQKEKELADYVDPEIFHKAPQTKDVL